MSDAEKQAPSPEKDTESTHTSSSSSPSLPAATSPSTAPASPLFVLASAATEEDLFKLVGPAGLGIPRVQSERVVQSQLLPPADDVPILRTKISPTNKKKRSLPNHSTQPLFLEDQQKQLQQQISLTKMQEQQQQGGLSSSSPSPSPDEAVAAPAKKLIPREGPSLVPPVVSECIRVLERKAMEIEGILRVSGSNAHIKELQKQFEKGKHVNLDDVEIHTVAGLLKNYFRDSDPPLLTYELYDSFLSTCTIGNLPTRIVKTRELIEKLPIGPQEVLHLLIVFILKVARNCEFNKMDKPNLATMFGPNLLRPPSQTATEMLRDMNAVRSVMLFLITNFTELFPDWPDDQEKKMLTEEEAQRLREELSSSSSERKKGILGRIVDESIDLKKLKKKKDKEKDKPKDKDKDKEKDKEGLQKDSEKKKHEKSKKSEEALAKMRKQRAINKMKEGTSGRLTKPVSMKTVSSSSLSRSVDTIDLHVLHARGGVKAVGDLQKIALETRPAGLVSSGPLDPSKIPRGSLVFNGDAGDADDEEYDDEEYDENDDEDDDSYEADEDDDDEDEKNADDQGPSKTSNTSSSTSSSTSASPSHPRRNTTRRSSTSGTTGSQLDLSLKDDSDFATDDDEEETDDEDADPEKNRSSGSLSLSETKKPSSDPNVSESLGKSSGSSVSIEGSEGSEDQQTSGMSAAEAQARATLQRKGSNVQLFERRDSGHLVFGKKIQIAAAVDDWLGGATTDPPVPAKKPSKSKKKRKSISGFLPKRKSDKFNDDPPLNFNVS